jgi:ubiquinone/menaquinone biosynthesis C-methylase UbiE
MTSVHYVCPSDRRPLRGEGDELHCDECNRTFTTAGGVLDLDVLKSGEREAFDARFRDQQSMTDAEISASRVVAARFLSHAGSPLSGKRILDMACGNGALTYGLLASDTVTGCEIFCFDHSAESMRVFLDTAARLETTNRLLPSIQDVQRFAYPDDFFDVIFGNAVLHHFTEYEAVLGQVYRSLRRGGVAVFAEPCAHGYVWVAFLLQLASAEASADTPDLGALRAFIDATFYGLDNYADKAALATMTDKHLFLPEDLANVCADIGFTVRFAPFEPAEYYAEFMNDMLRTYAIRNPDVSGKAAALFAGLQKAIPRSLHRIVPHFKFITLRKIG